MGTKTRFTLVFLVALCLLVPPLRCNAASVSELYQLYGKEFEVDVPDDVVHTISAYNGAKKYVSMYNYVVNSEFDDKALQDELKQLHARLDDLSYQLRNSYAASISHILDLEEEYSTCIKRIQDIESSYVSYDLNDSDSAPVNVPSYSEYSEAMRTKNNILALTEIGEIGNLKVPAQSSARLIDDSDDMCNYKVIDGTGVLSLFNGVVKDVVVDDDFGLTVIVDNNNGVLTYFCNLEIVDVQPGETVYQNQRLGYVYGTRLILRLQLGDDFVNISKLLEEV
ncbi:MAG: M23 family metallopeptidase [Ruminococcus flavefaciens]|nr:M23 family metallopeptidase [Ruminococcus flavefaciens]